MARNTDAATMYDLSGVLPVEELAGVQPGRSILVSGPAMTGKDALLLDLLADGLAGEDGAVAVTTNGPASNMIEGLESRLETVAYDRLGVIDCRAEGDRTAVETDDGAYVHHVGAPSDLTGIGIGLTKSFDRLQSRGVETARVGLTSLSTMVTYTDRKTVFKFCHVVSSRLDNAGFLGLFTIDEAAHDDQTLQVIKQAFDGMIELRERDGVREARAVGVQPDPSDWIEL